MLNWIVKGLMQWIYGMAWQMGEYIMNTLMDVFHMDMAYFKTAVPISDTILSIMFGVGWALLIGNLVFQASKSMMSGLGFEGDDPRSLGMRTLVFAFLLVCSRQICEIGLSIGATVNDLLQVPNSVILPSMAEDMFSIDASWFLVMIVGIILLFQLIKFFFEVGERYVILGVLTILSPLAFAMGGSRSTSDIFKGWARMYGSMCLMLVMNTVFMKLIVSAMAIYPRGLDVFPWLILVIGLARVARKIDSIIARIGLNPAITGDGLGRGFPGMMALMVGRQIISSFAGAKMGAAKAAAGAAKDVASGASAGAAARGAGFSGTARPAPSPVNTNPAAGGAGATPGAAGAGARTTASPVPAAAETTTGGSPAPVNPPVGRAGTSPQGNTNRSAGTYPFSTSAVHSPVNGRGTTARNGIAVSADDIPARQTTGDGNTSKPPQASRVNGTESAKSIDTNMSMGAAGTQGKTTATQDKPSRPPRGSSDTKPIDTSGTAGKASTPNGSQPAKAAAPIPVNPGQSSHSADRHSSGTAGTQTTSVRGGGVSPVQTSQSTSQGARVSSASSQGGAQVQSQSDTVQQGAQVHQSIQQNTQNMTRGGSVSAPQPVQPGQMGSTQTSAAPTTGRQQTSSAPAPKPTAQAGKTTAKTQAPKAAPKATPTTAAQTPKTTPKPLDLRTQGKQPKPAQPKTDKNPNSPKTTGKNQTPAPIDIGTDADVGDAALGVPPESVEPDETAVREHE